MTKKKLLILSCVLLVLVAGAASGFVLFRPQKAIIQEGSLSSRAKEYLKTQAGRNDTSLQSLAVDDKTLNAQKAGQHFTVGTCFSFTLPFGLSSNRMEKPCFGSFALLEPKGSLTIYEQAKAVSSQDNIPGVSMRKQLTDQYQESKQQAGSTSYLIFTHKDQYYEKTAFALAPGGYFVMTLSMQSGDPADLDAKFEQILQSVTFVKP